jgi:hypothetical protein
MTFDSFALQEKAEHLARQFFEDDDGNVNSFASWVLDICVRARDKDFLLIHNAGGWGNRALVNCLQWEKSIVNGVSDTLERLGYSWLLVQYFRCGNTWQEKIQDVKEQVRFFATKAKILAAVIEFVASHLEHLRVIMIGISQGAAFSNSVMQQMNSLKRVYSIELGMFFPYLSHRLITEKTLAIDSNGLVPDAAVRRDIKAYIRAYSAAPFRWTWHLLRGRPVRFINCVNVRGHNYDWRYPFRQQVVDFLDKNFSTTEYIKDTEYSGDEVRGVL